MKVAIHQPNFLPWLGYFYKISKVDLFVFLDDVQYIKRGFIHRNKIRSGNDAKWLTCSVATKGEYYQNINEARYSEPSISEEKIYGLLKENYKKAPFYDRYMQFLHDNLDLQNLSLAEQNIRLITAIMKEMNITTKLVRSSELEGIEGTSTERLISICRNTGADTYLAGFGAVNYQDDELFMQSGIVPVRSDFVHPVYNQVGEGFISNLSVIDFLFNAGDHPFSTL
jgi:hypothetical protein